MALARYHKDGSLDEGFGTAARWSRTSPQRMGRVRARRPLCCPTADTRGRRVYNTDYRDAWGVNHTDYYFTLIRYNSDGSLDDGTANDSNAGNSFGTAARR